MYVADHIARHWILNRYRIADLRLYLQVLADNGKTHSRYASRAIGVGHSGIVEGLKRLQRGGFVRLAKTRGGYHVTAVSQKKVPIPYPAIFKAELPSNWHDLRVLRTFLYATAINAGHFVASKHKQIGNKNQRSECGAAEVTLSYLAAQLGRDPSTISRQTTLAQNLKWLKKKPRLEIIHASRNKAEAIETANHLTQEGERVWVQRYGHLWAVCCISQTDINWLFEFKCAKAHKTPQQKAVIRALAKNRKGERLAADECEALEAIAKSEAVAFLRPDYIKPILKRKKALT